MRTEKQKMLAGELYRAGDAEIQADQATAKSWMVRYNAALGASAAERRALLRELLPEVGDGAVIRPPFHCDFGYNIRLGPDVFLNFNCVILDVVAVTIGAGTQIGPAVQIYTADHPRDPALREKPAPNSDARYRSDRMSGSAAARSSCRGSASATMPSSAPVQWSPATYRKAQPLSAIRRGNGANKAAAVTAHCRCDSSEVTNQRRFLTSPRP
jgi:hypothetical protein